MMKTMKSLATSLCLAGLLFAAACDDDTSPTDSRVGDAALDAPAGDAKTDGTTGDGPKADAKLTDGTPDVPLNNDAPPFLPDGFFLPDAMNPGNLVPCGPSQDVLACSDGNDNDGDGLIDALDPECTGPCDNSEGSFELDIPGVNKDCKQDCYWDYDSGAGQDDCDWNHRCDPKSPGAVYKATCAYDASFTACTTTQSQQCLDFCLPITPNGCDCFGCCEVYVNGVKYKDTIYLGSGTTCTAKTPQNCAPCTQQVGCMNGCGECELCLGKTVKDLPPKCFTPPVPDAGVPGDGPKPTDGPQPTTDGPKPDQGIYLPWLCPPGVQKCLTNNDCPTSYYCITGCCTLSID